MKIFSKNETKFDPVTSVDVNINKLIINKIKKSLNLIIHLFFLRKIKKILSL